TVSAFAIDHGPGTSVWGTLYAATDGSGVFRSTDGGSSWVSMNAGIAGDDLSITALALDPLPPATLYAGTATGKVFRFTTGGGSWQVVGSSLPGDVVSGCGAGAYCPDTIATRGQMAVFLVRAFNLPM